MKLESITHLSEALNVVFDFPYGYLSDNIIKQRPYGRTRSKDGIYSITNTQSAESTYAAEEFQNKQDGPATQFDIN
ncbi:MAG: hypothetical protein ACI9TI_002256 [Natronomonas sp.]|jgi:hypothetical protein